MVRNSISIAIVAACLAAGAPVRAQTPLPEPSGRPFEIDFATDPVLRLRHEQTAYDRFRDAIAGVPMAVSDPAETGTRTPLALEPRSDTLPQRIWWGSATRQSARWAGEQGFHLLSSTLLSEDTGVPFTR